MQKAALAHELRQRQYVLAQVPTSMIDAMTDDQMIWSYTTCSCCGEAQVPPERLSLLIWRATDADHFFALCVQHGRTHA